MEPVKNVIYVLVFGMFICMNGFSQNTNCVNCNNSGFEDGFGGGSWEYWYGDDGVPGCRSCNAQCAQVIPDFCVIGAGYNEPHHKLQTLGTYDPIVGGTTLPVVPPFGGNKSLRLGDGNAQMGDGQGVRSMASRATFTYMVTPATATFTYRYAIVIEEPSVGFPAHTPEERPFFNVRVFDDGHNTISCGDLFIVAIPPITDFVKAPDPNNTRRNDWYRNWSTVVLPLSEYIGQCVSIEFTSGDCGLGAHFGYAYIDASCSPAEGISTFDNDCGGHQLAAPNNAAEYLWTNKADGSTTGIVGPNDRQTVSVSEAGTYEVRMASLAGVACYTTLEITVDDPGPNLTSFTPLTGCKGTATKFTDTSTPLKPATGWAWDFDNDGVADAVNQNPVHSFPANGTYPVTLTMFVGSCASSVTQDVYVDLPIYPIIDPAGPFCISGNPVNLVTSIPGGTWSGPGITDAAAGVFTPSAANLGDNEIIYATSESCPGKDTITISINGPKADAGRDLTLCTGSSGSLGTLASPGYTYSWSPAIGLSSTTDANPSVTLSNSTAVPSTTSYSVVTTYTVSNCPATDVVDVTVNPIPVINAGTDQTICEGEFASFDASEGGATTSYTWSGGSGSFIPDNTRLNPVYSPSAFEIATGRVELIITTNDPVGPCNPVSDAVLVNILALPTIDAGPAQTVCLGSSVNLAGSIGGSATNGTWSGGAGGTFSPNNNVPNAVYTPGSTDLTEGSVTLGYITDDPIGPCGPASSQVRIQFDPYPTVDAGPDQTICTGTVSLAGTIGGGATTSIWSGGTGTFSPSNTSLTAVYTPSPSEYLTGGVTLTLSTNAVGSCPPSTDQISIKINNEATINAGPDQRVCINNPVASNTLILAGTYGGSSSGGTWSGGAGTFTADNSDPNAVYTLHSSEVSLQSITLTFTSDDPVGPCPAVSDAMTLIIEQAPTIDAGPDQTICNGTSASLRASVGGGASAVVWSGGEGTFSPSTTSFTPTYTPSPLEIALGNVVLSVSSNDPDGPCVSVNDQIQITINPEALANVGRDQIICIGSTVALEGIYNGSATSGSWSGGGGNFTPSNTAANPIYLPSVDENNNGFATLTYTTDDPAGPCPAASDQITFTINKLATVNAAPVNPVCYGESVTLKGSIGGNASSATWSGGRGTYSPDSTVLNAKYTPSDAEFAAGSVVLTLTSDDPNGPCPPATSRVAINLYPKPNVNYIVDDPDGCPVHCVEFTDFSYVSGGNAVTKWNWSFGDGGSSTEKSPSHCYKNTGVYDVSLAVEDNNGCTADLSIDEMITVYAEPRAEFYATPNPGSEIESKITFIDQSSTDVNFWVWDFGDGDTISPNIQHPIHEYSNEPNREYWPTLTVRNTDYCYNSIAHKITILPAFSFFIPNAFSPYDSKGVNDYFGGKGIGIIKYDLWIFDRWGNMIFHSKDLDEHWNGKVEGGIQVAQMDVYVWKVELIDVFKKPHEYIGTVTLVK